MNIPQFDVIIIGGSYSGLSAAMALARALKTVLVIDDGLPCNRQTPHSHNFLTQDGATPAGISAAARQQVEAYKTVAFHTGRATSVKPSDQAFDILTDTGARFTGRKLVFATGISDVFPDIKGFAECWGISVIHCPYCHGYEVRNASTGILASADAGFEFAKLISNWTTDLTLYTNGDPGLSKEQLAKLAEKRISIVEKTIVAVEHENGFIQNLLFADDSRSRLRALYAPRPFKQHCSLPEALGCELNDAGYLKIDASMQTTVDGIYACGDNASRMRTVSNAIAMGTSTGLSVSKQLIAEQF